MAQVSLELPYLTQNCKGQSVVTSFPRRWNASWKTLKRIGPTLWCKSFHPESHPDVSDTNSHAVSYYALLYFPFRCVLTTYSSQNLHMIGLSKLTCTRDSGELSGRSKASHSICTPSVFRRFLNKVTFFSFLLLRRREAISSRALACSFHLVRL